MSVQAANVSRSMSHQGHDIGVTAQHIPFSSSPYAGSPVQIPQHLTQQLQHQVRMNTPMPQRLSHTPDQVPGAASQTAQGIPAAHLPPGYLQSQIMRQRQAAAAAAAANWTMQQERMNAVQKAQPTHRLGSAILRLLNYSEQMNSFAESSDLDAWKRFVDEFYVDPALCTHSLPNDTSLSYELPTPLLPTYFHQLHREVSKFALTFHDAQEFYMPPANHVVECPKATLCYYYPNLTKVEMLGRLRVVFTPGPGQNATLKIENWEFVAETWDEWLCRRPPAPNKPQNSRDATYDDNDLVERGQSQGDKSSDAESPEARRSGPEDAEDNDHEDLFGRSPSGSMPASSRPPSRANNKAEDEKPQPRDDNVPSSDLNARKRMVLECGITARHMRMLETSDVLGQLSPLFGRGNPKNKLENLLKSLPALPEDQKLLVKQAQKLRSNGSSSPKVQSGPEAVDRGQATTDKDPSRQAADHEQSISGSQTVVSGRSMQQEAAQLLQKQAAQTLSQALPPEGLTFNEEDVEDQQYLEEGGNEIENDEEKETEHGDNTEDQDMGDTDDFFNSPGLLSDGHGQEVKQEEEDEEDNDAMGEIDLELDAQGERDSAFGDDDFTASLEDAVGMMKREGDEISGPGKKLKTSDNFEQD